jgi:hypothetical protein
MHTLVVAPLLEITLFHNQSIGELNIKPVILCSEMSQMSTMLTAPSHAWHNYVYLLLTLWFSWTHTETVSEIWAKIEHIVWKPVWSFTAVCEVVCYY